MKIPAWKGLQRIMDLFTDKGLINHTKDTEVSDEYLLFERHCNGKIDTMEHFQKLFSSEDRWLEIFVDE